MLASNRARHCGVCGSNAAVPHEERWRTVAQSASDLNAVFRMKTRNETSFSDEIENRKLNGEKRNKWREIRQAHYARLAPPTPSADRILMQLSRAARSTSRTSADDAASGRAGASGASSTFLSMRVCRRSAASHARLLACSGAVFSSQRVQAVPHGRTHLCACFQANRERARTVSTGTQVRILSKSQRWFVGRFRKNVSYAHVRRQ